jgi:hypothetical protein
MSLSSGRLTARERVEEFSDQHALTDRQVALQHELEDQGWTVRTAGTSDDALSSAMAVRRKEKAVTAYCLSMFLMARRAASISALSFRNKSRCAAPSAGVFSSLPISSLMRVSLAVSNSASVGDIQGCYYHQQ